jgi:hypothetical protein
LAPDTFRDDRAGQMMMLSAILLVIGFIALVGLVSRVNQLGARTSTETEQPILDKVGPLAEAIDAAVAKLGATPANGGFNRTATSNPTWEAGVRGVMEHLQMMHARQGLLLDYELRCADGSTPSQGQVVARLTDGLVWVEVKSSAFFVRDGGSCTPLQG